MSVFRETLDAADSVGEGVLGEALGTGDLARERIIQPVAGATDREVRLRGPKSSGRSEDVHANPTDYSLWSLTVPTMLQKKGIFSSHHHLPEAEDHPDFHLPAQLRLPA